MERKRCSLCKEEKDRSQFNKNRSKKDGLQNKCRHCSKTVSKDYYRNNDEFRSSLRISNRERRKELRDKIRSYLESHPCVDCGEPDPVVLDFDHVRGKKVMDVMKMVNNRMSWSRIEREISKCQVRCANCHRRKTYLERRTR